MIEVSIEHDHDAESPRQDSHLGTMVFFGRHSGYGDEHEFKTPEDFDHYCVAANVIRLPVYAYVHSGITISTKRTGQYADRWDSGQLGYIYATREQVRECYKAKRMGRRVTERALKALQGEVQELDDYMVYGMYTVEVCEDEELVDSIGSVPYELIKNGDVAEEFEEKYREAIREECKKL